jgi:hypothetical protein
VSQGSADRAGQSAQLDDLGAADIERLGRLGLVHRHVENDPRHFRDVDEAPEHGIGGADGDPLTARQGQDEVAQGIGLRVVDERAAEVEHPRDQHRPLGPAPPFGDCRLVVALHRRVSLAVRRARFRPVNGPGRECDQSPRLAGLGQGQNPIQESVVAPPHLGLVAAFHPVAADDGGVQDQPIAVSQARAVIHRLYQGLPVADVQVATGRAEQSQPVGREVGAGRQDLVRQRHADPAGRPDDRHATGGGANHAANLHLGIIADSILDKGKQITAD